MNKKHQKDNPIIIKSISFSVKIIKLSDQLFLDNRRNLSNQLIKSGTSIGANIREAQNAESKLDFIHKMKIAAKEIDETEYWLELIEKSYDKYDINDLNIELDEIARIVNSIISTSKKTLKISKLDN